MRNFAEKSKYSLILPAVAALVLLVVVSPAYAGAGRTINIVGQDAIWGGPNTYISSTYVFGTGPVFVRSGTIVMLHDTTQDIHSLTLTFARDLPSSAEAALSCGSSPSDICSTAAGPGMAALGAGDVCVMAGAPAAGGLSAAAPCQLSTPFNAPTPNGDEVVISPGQTLYLLISGAPGTVLHFMCIIHPWMQGEFIITK